MKLHIVILATAMLCCAGNLTARQLSFQSISSITPLPSEEVRKLYQDSDGYLWISTYGGLLRYDGYDCLLIKSDRSTRKQVISGTVNMVREEGNSMLWIGTNSGLFSLDKNTGKISKEVVPVLESSHIEAILPSRDGSLWVATNHGLFMRRGDGEGFVHCCGEEWGLEAIDLKALVQDEAGYLWLGTWDRSLIRYDPQSRHAYSYDSVPQLRSPHTLFIDRDRQLWVGTWGEGLVMVLNPYASTKPQIVQYRTHSRGNGILDDIIYAIAQEPLSGDLWIGSRSGLSILPNGSFHDPAAKFTNYAPATENDLPFNEINSIIPTRDNLMWLGSLGGGVFWADTQPKLIRSDALDPIRHACGTGAVRALSLARDGRLRMCIAGHGLFEYDTLTRRFTRHDIDYIQDFHETADMTLIGTERGIWVCRGGSGPEKLDIAGFSDPFITCFREDAEGRLWVGTRTDFGIVEGDRYRPVNSLLAPGQEPVPEGYVSDLRLDRSGRIWAATYDNGVFRCRSDKDGMRVTKVENPLTDGALCLFADGSGKLWAGTENGLYTCAAGSDSFVPVRPDDSFLSRGTAISNIWEDRRGSVWAASNKGVVQMSGDRQGQIVDVHIYTRDDGLADLSFPRRTAVMTDDGTVIIGSAHGLSFIPLMDAPGTDKGSTVTITDFRVFDRSIRELPEKERNGITDRAIDRSGNFRLNWKRNNFTIEFALLGFRGAASASYAYMLEGYDRDWISADTRHRTAYYNNLRPGTYRFMVKAASSYSGWSEPTEITVSITPAPWASWWAYCLYVLAVLGLGSAFFIVTRNRMRTQKKLELSEINRKKSEELSHTKLQFFTNITHELMTPLTIIIAAVEELKAEEPERKQYDFITENAMRLMRLIQQILEFRKAESGNLKLKVVKGDITAFVRNCVVAFRPLADKKKISYRFVQVAKAPIVGCFDSDKLDKILYNLLSNAAKYNREGGSVTVSADADITGRSLVLKVSDTGEGMSREQMEHLFQRFYDGDYRRHNTIGTGIGLSLVKNLVDLHHGRITVESTKGEGTTFTVLLPISEDAYTASETESLTMEKSGEIQQAAETSDGVSSDAASVGEGAEPSEKATILVVEDNADLLSLMKSHLEKSYDVVTAPSADDALPILREKEGIRLVLSDIMMPGMNGYDFCAHIKNTLEYCHIPVILLTAKQTSADKITGYEVGADAYITKPFDMKVLDAMIAGQLRRGERTGSDYRRQMVFNPGELNYTTMDEKFLQKAVDYVNEHIGDFDFSLADFIKAMNMSRSTLAEKMKSLTGMTPSAFVNDIRLNAAVKILQDNAESAGKIRVSELAYAVGFNDPKYFSTLFKKKFRVNPGDWKKQQQ